jgi:hypothetical protein
MHQESAIEVGVGQREKELRVCDGTARLLQHFTCYALFDGLVHITETTRQIECTLGWLLGTTTYQQLIPIVDDDSNGCRRGVEIVDKATVSAAVSLFVVTDKCTSTLRTVVERMERVR